MSAKSIANILSKYELNYINEKVILILNSESFKCGKIRQISAYLVEALKNDYKYQKPTKPSEKYKCEELEIEKNKKSEKMRLLYSQYISSTISERLLVFSEEKKQMIVEQFEVSLKSGAKIIYTWFQKKRLEHPAIKALFNNFVRNYEPETFKDLLTFEKFEQSLV